MKVTCAGCGAPFVSKSSRAKWCGATCRQRAARSPAKKAAVAKTSSKPRRRQSPFELATRRELTRLKKLDTMLGQQALVLAKRMSSDHETGAAISALSREHSRIMEQLGASAPAGDALDEIQRRRQEKLQQMGLG